MSHMSHLHPLLVMRDRKEAERLADMLAGVVFAAPAYADSLKGALEHMRTRPFGLVILRKSS